MFDDIRPYLDSEIPAAMQRIVSDKYFPLVCDFLFPDTPVQEIAVLLGSCRTVEEFQMRVMYKVIYAIAHKTTNGLSVSGMERLDPDKDYLFVSNHRDIMMDAGFLQVLLTDAGRKTSEITFFHDNVDNIADDADHEKDKFGSVSYIFINGICTYVQLK